MWLRWIAWTLLLVLCINSVGTTALAIERSSAETENMNQSLTQEEKLLAEESVSDGGDVSDTERPSMQDVPQKEESTLETEQIPEESASETQQIPEESTSETEQIPEESTLETEQIPEESILQEEPLQERAKIQVSDQGFDIDFCVIIEKKKVKLQHNGIPSIATWKNGRKTYHGISVDDLVSVYKDFGFVKGSDGQNPDAVKKFVSAYRNKSSIDYGTVYTDTESGKTYVSFNDGEGKQGEAVDVYYVPKGRYGNPLLGSNVKENNSFYSVTVKGEGQDQISYALVGTTAETTVSDYNPELPEKNDRIEWTCIGADDTVIDGLRESGDMTTFRIKDIYQSYVIQRADYPVQDIQFYVYVDNEIRKLPSDSLKKVYKWNNHGRCYLSISDLAEIYKEYGLKDNEKQFGSYFPAALRGDKTLSHGAMQTYKGKQYVSYTQEDQDTSVPTDVYYMPKGSDNREKVPQDIVDENGNITTSVADQLKQNRHSFYSVTVTHPDGSQSVTYHKKDDNVTISVNPGDTLESDWLCMSEDENRTIQPIKNGQNMNFTIQRIEQPFRIAYKKFAAEKINIKFYTFVDYERFNVEQIDVPVLKDTTRKPGTTYYYISNEQLKIYLDKFHYDGQMQNGNRERFYYSKRDYDSLHNAGKEKIDGHDCIYIGKTGEPMDVYYLPDGEILPLLNVKTLMEYHDNRYNGFYSVKVQDDNGQVYTPTELENLPAIDFVARKGTLTRVVSTKPHAEGQTEQINWECRRQDGTLADIEGIKNEADQTMSFTITPEDALQPYVIVPDNTEKPAEIKEANISFYVFIDGDYKLIKNINVEQHYITKANSGFDSRYYLRARESDAVSQIYKEFGFTPDKLEPGADHKEKILFGYATDTRVFVEHPYKDKDGIWYIPVLKNGHDVSVYYFSQPNPLNPDKLVPYFDRLTGLSAQVGVAGRRFDWEASFHLMEVLDPLNLTKGQAILKRYVAHGQHYRIEVPKKAILEGEYQGQDIIWSCTSDDKNVGDVIPDSSGKDTVVFDWPKVEYSYKVVADKPQDPNTIRIIYDTTRYMKKMPKEAKLTPQVGNKTRFTEDIPEEGAANYIVKSPYPLTYDHEDNNSKELEQYEFDHWDYKDEKGRWRECDSGSQLSDIINTTPRPIVFYASWNKVSDFSRKQVQFYICKAAMPEDSSIALPSVNENDFTSAVSVANCNVAATRLDDNVQIVGNKNPGSWDAYVNGHKRVMDLLQGTKPDRGSMGGDAIYKIDRIPSDEEVFQTIRESGRPIRIGDREIPLSKLDTEFFTIYWYSFNSRLSDGWHIDGRIVAKNGYLTVKKDFVGASDVIKEIQKDYYISVDMDATFSDGTPQPPAFHEHMKLVLPSQDGQAPTKDGAEQVVGTWDDESHTSCTWIVKADPFWKYTLKEHNYKPKDSKVNFSGWYNIYNSHEQGENVNTWELYPENSGIKFTGRGMGRGGESLTIELENRYQKPGVLTLNKFDAISGQGMADINFDVSLNGVLKDSVTTDKNGIAELAIALQDEKGQNRVATETYLLRETNIPVGYIDPGDVQLTVEIADGAFKIADAKLVDRQVGENQDAVQAPENGQIDGKSVLMIRGDTSLNIRNFSKNSKLHIKKTWGNPNDAITEKQVKIRLYRDGISTGQEFVLDEKNNWEYTVDNVPLFLDKKPVEYKIEEVTIGKTHYSPEFGDGFLYYEVIYSDIQYKDAAGQLLSPKNEQEFKEISKIELGVENLHFNLAEKSFLKTDDRSINRLEGAEFMLYEVPYKEGTLEYVDDTGYTVESVKDLGKDTIVLKKDGQRCTPIQKLPFITDKNGMLHIPDTVPKGRYWMVESSTPYKDVTGKPQYKDNFSLYMVEVEDEIIFLYEKGTDARTWKPLTDRHVVNYPHKGGVTVSLKKEVTGPFGERDKRFEVTVLYREDGMKMYKRINTKLKHGEELVIPHVDIGSEIEITETVDLSKYDVSLAQKAAGDSYMQAVKATENAEQNTAFMKYTVNGMPGDVIELKITNQNTEDATPDTGIHLENSLYVWMLIIIIIAAIWFFWKRRKNRIERD